MSNSTPQIEVVKQDSLSINDLVQKQAEGFSVMRSAHVGNFSPYNLALAEVGIDFICVDQNITGVDTNYRPELIRFGGNDYQVADLGRLVCRAELTSTDDEVDKFTSGFNYLDDMHMAALRKLFGGVLLTNTEYLRANESRIQEMVRLATIEFPNFFNRLALPGGIAVKRLDAASLVRKFGIMQLNDDPRAETEAVIMPNILDIVANFVVETLNTGRDTQYHLSGPDFVKYIDKLMPDINKFYARFRQTASFGQQLPENIKVFLVPTTDARFATSLQRQAGLDNLVEALVFVDLELAVVQKDRKNFFSAPVQPSVDLKKSQVAQFKAREKSLDGALREALDEYPEIVVEPGQPGHTTQYDAIEEGGIYITDINRQLPMSQLSKFVKQLKNLRKTEP